MIQRDVFLERLLLFALVIGLAELPAGARLVLCVGITTLNRY